MKQEYSDVETPSVLPKPQTEFKDSVAGTPSGSVISEKELSQIVEKIHGKGQVTDQTLRPSSTQPALATPQVDNSVNSGQATNGATTLIADDVDLIEKEWIEKAKNIISSTKNDPYIQNKELNKVKAEYLKARFNKEVKIAQS